MTTQIKLRRGTAADWTSADPTLGTGEVGLETDTFKAKFGDGATAWSGLSYIVAPDATALTAATTFAGDAAGLYNALVVDRMSQDINFTADATITDTGTLSDYAASATIGVLRWNGASALTLTGITGGADGRVIFLINVTAAQTLTLTHDATSTAANRFYLPDAVALDVAPLSGVMLYYDNTLTRWEVIGHRRHLAQDTLWAAKGDLIVGTANNTAAVLSSSASNDQVLTVDTAQATGLKWADAPGGVGAGASYAGTWRYPGF